MLWTIAVHYLQTDKLSPPKRTTIQWWGYWGHHRCSRHP